MNHLNNNEQIINNFNNNQTHWGKYHLYYLVFGSFVFTTLIILISNLSISNQVGKIHEKLAHAFLEIFKKSSDVGGQESSFEKPNPTLINKNWIDETIVQTEVRKEIRKWINTFKLLPAFQKNKNLELDKHVLFTGPPGSGKSFIIQQFCQNETSGFVNAHFETQIWSGSSIEKQQKIFEEVKRLAKINKDKGETKPIAIVIEEIDSVGVKDSSKYDKASSQEVNGVLKIFDDINKELELNIIVIATTNNPETLNEALVRPGRLGKRIYVEYPTESETKGLIEYLQKNSQDNWGTVKWPNDYWIKVDEIVKKLGKKYRDHNIGISFRDLQKATTASLAETVSENSSEIIPNVQSFETDLEKTLNDRKTDLENKIKNRFPS